MVKCESLSEAMKKKNVTQARLAEIVGKSQKTLSCWCTHTRKPGVDDIAKLCIYFDLPAETVINWFTTSVKLPERVQAV